MSLIVFGIHLVLLGCLVYRSGYIPRFVGVALLIAGAGWVVGGFGPYIFPKIDFDFTQMTAVGELVFILWLWIRGWRIREPVAIS